MLAVQEMQAPMLGTKFFVGKGLVTLGDLMQFKRAFSVALWDRESDHEILQVLDRAADDNKFAADLTYQGAKALETYHLTTGAKAALLSGDIRWIEARVGKLDKRLQTWLLCRLEQEIW